LTIFGPAICTSKLLNFAVIRTHSDEEADSGPL
jgi:hypothetical protein